MKIWAVAVLAAISGGIFQAQGGTVWDSLGSADAGTANFDVTTWRASAFRVTGSAPVTISAISMDLAGTVSGTVNVRLLADNSGLPGTPLGRISDIPLNAGATGIFDAPSDTVFTLNPGSLYWVTVRMRPSTGAGNLITKTTATETTFQGSGLTYLSSLSSANSGSSWQPWTDVPGMKLDIVQVPEPGALALIGAGILGVAAFSLRRRTI